MLVNPVLPTFTMYDYRFTSLHPRPIQIGGLQVKKLIQKYLEFQDTALHKLVGKQEVRPNAAAIAIQCWQRGFVTSARKEQICL